MKLRILLYFFIFIKPQIKALLQHLYSDCYVIIWKLNEDGSFSQPNTSIDGGDYENKESWQVAKMLR